MRLCSEPACGVCEACLGKGYIGLDWTPVVQRCDMCQVYESDIEAARFAAQDYGLPYHCLQCERCGYWDMTLGNVTSLYCSECHQAIMVKVDFPRPYGQMSP